MIRPRKSPTVWLASLVTAVLLAGSSAPAGEVILQYFDGRWDTIERRMPDIFMAGYDALWVPPPGRADSGGFSVGYDVFDRFDLGTPYSPTLYGTTESFTLMSREMRRAGIGLYVDTVLNHNGFRTGDTPGFEANGGYPGFVTRLPNDPDGDFHGAFEGGDLNGRLAGLIDIAQEKNYRWHRHPVPGFPNNIPNETPRESNRAFYPDRDLPADAQGRHPFNLANPLAGDPVIENTNDLLMRYLQWLVQVHGATGFRLDATKHIPTWFFNDIYDGAVHNLGRNPISGEPFTPFSFGENYSGDFGLLNAYVRKDGFGNRDTKDFPLYFAMRGVFSAGGFGSMRDLEFASFDRVDGNANDGSRGVLFAGSHDDFYAGREQGLDNLAVAHILTRTGLPIIYYNAKEFGDGRDFPKDGRGDALGNYINIIPRLVQINDVYIKGAHFTRWIDDDVYIYERAGAALIGLNDRKDGGFAERSITTSFAQGTRLVELTGNARDAAVDPFNDIPDVITVGPNGQVTFRVPNNTRPGSTLQGGGFHGRGYVVYGPQAPASQLVIANAEGTIGPDPANKVPESSRRLTTLHIVRQNTINVQLTVPNSTDAPSDNALVKVNFGELDIDGDGTRNAHGEFAGFESFPDVASTPAGRVYTANIDATTLEEGYNYIETVAFLQRPAGTPPIYDLQRRVVYLDRFPPAQTLAFPAQTGEGDIRSRDYEAVVRVDRTVNSVHILTNVAPGATDEQIIGLLSDANRARRHDRLEYRRNLTNLAVGPLELTVVAFEESGNRSIKRYGNIDVRIPLPDLALGIDTNPSPTSVNFQSFPARIETPALNDEILIRVRTQNVDGNGLNITFPADYTVELDINGVVYTAVPYSADLLPPVGRLVQNDQNLGDPFDEFRLLWRGYSRGDHTIRARARLLTGETPNETIVTTTVAQSTPGPSVTLISPAPSGTTVLTRPTEIRVDAVLNDSFAAYIQAFIDVGAVPTQLGSITNPARGQISLARPTDSLADRDNLEPGAIALRTGTFPVRLQASTGPNGTGIVTEISTTVTVDGVSALPSIPRVTLDGTAAGPLARALPIAVSNADGPASTSGTADFGADGTLTELRGFVQDGNLVLVLRGDLFGAENTNLSNASFVFIDINAGSGNGAKDLAADLTDESDGLRRDISAVNFRLSPALIAQGIGFDAVVGMNAPGVAYGYTFGSDGTPGSTALFEFQPGISASFATGLGTIPAAPGTTYAAPDAFVIVVPMASLGNPDPAKVRLAAVTASNADNGGFPSPNMLPENSSNAFDPVQLIESVAPLPFRADRVLLNELTTGQTDRVELHNPGTSAVALGGWRLELFDSAGVATGYTFPPGVSIAGGGYLVVNELSGTDSAAEVHTGFNIPWDPTRGGAVALVEPFGIGRDYVAWRGISNRAETDTGVIPYGTAFTGTVQGADANAGHSLARDANSTDTDRAADWDPNSGVDSAGPTFGARNIGGVLPTSSLWLLF